MYKVSVAMATYNGQNYIEAQLESILTQINKDDEIVISDDGSTDNTIKIVGELQKTYSQIKLIKGPQKGVVRNFMNAIENCSNDIIFLSDQDDIWCENKYIEVMKCFKTDSQVEVVLHNAKIMQQYEVNNARLLKYRKGFWINLIKSSYWGCCMAMTKKFANKHFIDICNCHAHDQIIGLIAEKEKKVLYLDKDLIYHRVHDLNETKKLSLKNKIKFRYNIFKDFFC